MAKSTPAKSTQAVAALQRAGVAFTLHTYEYDPGDQRVGLQAAEAGGKAAKMMPPADAERITGYIPLALLCSPTAYPWIQNGLRHRVHGM